MREKEALVGNKASAKERLEAVLCRIASSEFEGPKVFTEIFADSAVREAEAADARRAGGRTIGPLDGRIVSIKALFDVAGKVTHAGSAILRGQPPAKDDALVVKRLRSAGGVVIGKTQMTEFAFSAIGTNPHDGSPGNPQDRRRVPGGSSSGAVVSVVDDMAEIAIGSDTGGSVRIPAAMSGAVGFKPTREYTATKGVFPLSWTLDTVGSIATCIADCALANQILSGQPIVPVTSAAPGSFVLVVPRGRLFDRTDQVVSENFENAVELLRGAGATVLEGSLDTALDALAAIDRIGNFCMIEMNTILRKLGFHDLKGVDPNIRAKIEAGADVPVADYMRMVRMREAAVRSFASMVPSNEIFILPTVPIRAPLLSSLEETTAFDESDSLLLRNPRVANLLDCPSISLPIPGAGMPVGLMLIGRRNSDRQLVDVASWIEAALTDIEATDIRRAQGLSAHRTLCL